MSTEIIAGGFSIVGMIIGVLSAVCIEKQKQKHDDKVYTWKARYDNRLSRYQELSFYSSTALFDIGALVNCLCKDNKPQNTDARDKAIASFNNFQKAVYEYSICIDESIYQMYKTALNQIRCILLLFEGWCSDNDGQNIYDPITCFSETFANRDALKAQIESSVVGIQEYLNGLRAEIRTKLNRLELNDEKK